MPPRGHGPAPVVADTRVDCSAGADPRFSVMKEGFKNWFGQVYNRVQKNWWGTIRDINGPIFSILSRSNQCSVGKQTEIILNIAEHGLKPLSSMEDKPHDGIQKWGWSVETPHDRLKDHIKSSENCLHENLSCTRLGAGLETALWSKSSYWIIDK